MCAQLARIIGSIWLQVFRQSSCAPDALIKETNQRAIDGQGGDTPVVATELTAQRCKRAQAAPGFSPVILLRSLQD